MVMWEILLGIPLSTNNKIAREPASPSKLWNLQWPGLDAYNSATNYIEVLPLALPHHGPTYFKICCPGLSGKVWEPAFLVHL